MSIIRITDISPTQFNVEFKDDTDTIVESSIDFDKDGTLVEVQAHRVNFKDKSTNTLQQSCPTNQIAEPTFTNQLDLHQQLITICFT